MRPIFLPISAPAENISGGLATHEGMLVCGCASFLVVIRRGSEQHTFILLIEVLAVIKIWLGAASAEVFNIQDRVTRVRIYEVSTT